MHRRSPPRWERETWVPAVETAEAPAPRASTSLDSWIAWGTCVAILVATNLFIEYVGAGLEADPRRSLFSWPVIALFGALGALGVFLASRTGFPSAFDRTVSNRERWLWPALLGLVFGGFAVAAEIGTGGIEFILQETGLERFNAPLPGSVLFYTGGAIILEVFYRLLPIPLVLWLVSNLALRGRHRSRIFWVLAVLTSAIEPVQQTAVALEAGRYAIAGTQAPLGFLDNLSQAAWFRRAGFVASLTVRLAMYLVWHIIYGGWICDC
jgi:hypothetical protein